MNKVIVVVDTSAILYRLDIVNSIISSKIDSVRLILPLSVYSEICYMTKSGPDRARAEEAIAVVDELLKKRAIYKLDERDVITCSLKEDNLIIDLLRYFKEQNRYPILLTATKLWVLKTAFNSLRSIYIEHGIDLINVINNLVEETTRPIENKRNSMVVIDTSMFINNLGGIRLLIGDYQQLDITLVIPAKVIIDLQLLRDDKRSIFTNKASYALEMIADEFNRIHPRFVAKPELGTAEEICRYCSLTHGTLLTYDSSSREKCSKHAISTGDELIYSVPYQLSRRLGTEVDETLRQKKRFNHHI